MTKRLRHAEQHLQDVNARQEKARQALEVADKAVEAAQQQIEEIKEELSKLELPAESRGNAQ